MLDDTRLPGHSLMQDPAFAQALQMCGQSPVYLPNGQMVLQRRVAGLQIAMLPRATPPPELPELLHAVNLHRCPLILSPQTRTPLPRAFRLQGPRDIALWDITGSIMARRDALHPKWRNQLKRAEAEEIKVTRHRLTPDADGPVLRTAIQQAPARGYTLWPAPLTAAFAAAAPAQTHLFRASLKGTEIAHVLFLSHGTTATYHIGHITDLGKSLCAHNLLLWRAAQHFGQRGLRCLDLGIIDGKTPGLDRFKRRTGAVATPTGGTHLYWRPLGFPAQP